MILIEKSKQKRKNTVNKIIHVIKSKMCVF